MTSATDQRYAARASGSIAGARSAALLILYLLLAAGVFGGVLLEHMVWRARIQDAISISESISRFLRLTASMNPTKNTQFRASFNSTISQTLDGKLPMLLKTNYLYTPWWETLARMKVSSTMHEADLDLEVTHQAMQHSIAGGFTVGYDVATMLNVILQICWWTPILQGWDALDVLSMEGFSLAFLPAMGALVSAAWTSNFETRAHDESHEDEEMGHAEKNH
ncbi:MAG: hypothetical protein Q9224_004908 [Gallowayella concinna]